ncbi:MAG: histidine phosphatase family protein [Clostridia bacterium]|nr:histidine phosphatase family protein [Clostridia bacterium]
MRIIFVRHGEPNYEKDCLTETGKRQAAAAAERLVREGITTVYSSPMGRARETAAFTAERLGLPIRTLDYMHEISWGGEDTPAEGHPWTLSQWMIDQEDFDFTGKDWRKHPYYARNVAVRYLDEIAGKFDDLLLEHGYRHEGGRYLCETDTRETFAVFSHGGSGACVLAHLLALPFPYVCTVLPYEFTSIIILEFPVRKGEYVHPRIELFNDTAHTLGLSSGLQFQKKADTQ